jgi:hypothetical protein
MFAGAVPAFTRNARSNGGRRLPSAAGGLKKPATDFSA